MDGHMWMSHTGHNLQGSDMQPSNPYLAGGLELGQRLPRAVLAAEPGTVDERARRGALPVPPRVPTRGVPSRGR